VVLFSVPAYYTAVIPIAGCDGENAAPGLMIIMSLIFFGRRKQIADLAGLDEELDG